MHMLFLTLSTGWFSIYVSSWEAASPPLSCKLFGVSGSGYSVLHEHGKFFSVVSGAPGADKTALSIKAA